MPKILTVIGATGAQGSSVLRSFLVDPDEDWQIRAITRNPDSASAKAIKAIAPERITLQRGDTASRTDMMDCMRGAAVVFAMTDYWAPFASEEARKKYPSGSALRKFAYEDEIRLGKNTVDAAAAVLAESLTSSERPTLERFVFSGLPSPSKVSGGKYKHIYHFESKAEIEKYLRETHSELAKRTSVVYVGFYASNFLKMRPMWPVKLADGSFIVQRICDGDAKMPFIITDEDTGPIVHAMVLGHVGSSKASGDVSELPALAYTAMISWSDMTRLWGESTGKRVSFQQLTLQEYMEYFPVEGEELLSAPYAAEFGYAGREGFLEPSDFGLKADEGKIKEWFRKQDWSDIFDAAPRKV